MIPELSGSTGSITELPTDPPISCLIVVKEIPVSTCYAVGRLIPGIPAALSALILGGGWHYTIPSAERNMTPSKPQIEHNIMIVPIAREVMAHQGYNVTPYVYYCLFANEQVRRHPSHNKC